jgi:hypothetical protein
VMTPRIPRPADSADWLAIRQRTVSDTLRRKTETAPAPVVIHAAIAGGSAAWAERASAALAPLVSGCTACPGGAVQPDDALLQAAPELLVLLDGGRLPELATLLRLKATGTRIAAWMAELDRADGDRGAEPWPGEMLEACDSLFLADSACWSQRLRPGGPAAFELAPAADLSVYFPADPGDTYRSDVLVLGAEAVLADRLGPILQALGQQLPGRRIVVPGAEGAAVTGLEYARPAGPSEAARQINGAAVVIQLAEDGTDGPSRLRYLRRLDQVAACGVAQIAQQAPGLAARYTPDLDIAVFWSVEELIRLAQQYLDDGARRQRLALSALNRLWSSHTDSEQMEQLLLSACPERSVAVDPPVCPERPVSRLGFPLSPQATAPARLPVKQRSRGESARRSPSPATAVAKKNKPARADSPPSSSGKGKRSASPAPQQPATAARRKPTGSAKPVTPVRQPKPSSPGSAKPVTPVRQPKPSSPGSIKPASPLSRNTGRKAASAAPGRTGTKRQSARAMRKTA